MNKKINKEDVPNVLGDNADNKSDNATNNKIKENKPNRIRTNYRVKTSQISKERIAHKLSSHFKKSANDDDVPDIL